MIKTKLKKALSLPLKNKKIRLQLEKLLQYTKNDNNPEMMENGEAWLIEQYAQNWGVVFDVGANMGLWTNFVKKNNKESVIHAFEPVQKTFKCLSDNVSSNKKIYLHNIALGAHTDEALISIFSEDHGLSSISRKDSFETSKTTSEKIHIETVDSFCKAQNINSIDMLKIDVEGYELEVLKGASDMIKKGAVKMIQFEYGSTYIDARIYLADVFTFFQDKPYKIYKLMHKSLQPIPYYNEKLETMRCCNYVCIYNESKQ